MATVKLADTVNSLGFVNTQYFQPAANYFRKFGRYDDGVEGTYYHEDYWNEEIRRCLNGYSVGGTWISGFHYFYLNYCRIQLVEEVKQETYGTVHDKKPRKERRVGKRSEDFPAFWDVDYMYFRSLDIAMNGISDEEYAKLPMELNIHPDFRDGGHHFVYLKPRGVGASWKGAGMPLRNYSLIRKSNSYMLANEREFLTKDGLWTKFHELNNWLIGYNDITGNINAPAIGKISDFKADNSELYYEASVKVDGKKAGYLSNIFGVSLQNNWQKARGKRGQIILWEELGKFPNADLAWNVARPSVEEGDITYGVMIGFGTGGTEGANFEAIKNMFYDPLAYGFFTPAYMKTAFIDANGNSLIDKGKAYYDSERETAKRAKDPTKLPRVKAEDPYTPQEAVLTVGKNIFMTQMLLDHKKYVELNNLHNTIPQIGVVERSGKEVKFIPKLGLEPIHKYPHNNKYNDYYGAVLQFQVPYKKNGRIPENLYKLCVDPYRHDTTTGDSIGAIYVIEQSNNFTPTRGDLIVAAYVGRPETQDEFNRILFDLNELYNGEIAFENDEPGDIVGYAKKHKKLEVLAEEFQLAFDEQIRTSEGSKRKFGIHMASGVKNQRKKQGDIFIKNWLYTVRYIREDGSPYLNLHTIYDLGLLEEFIGYDIDKNCDRISALRVGVYHMQELMYNEIAPRDVNIMDSKRQFFDRELFV